MKQFGRDPKTGKAVGSATVSVSAESPTRGNRMFYFKSYYFRILTLCYLLILLL